MAEDDFDCKLGDIRWLEHKRFPNGEVEHIFMYYVDKLGNPAKLDETMERPALVASDYTCLTCSGAYNFWVDVEEHLEDARKQQEGDDEDSYERSLIRR